MKVQFIIPLFLSVLFIAPVHAQSDDQDPKREIGVRMSSLDNFDFMYKKYKKENNLPIQSIPSMLLVLVWTIIAWVAKETGGISHYNHTTSRDRKFHASFEI